MKIVWAHPDGVTVRAVYEALRARRAIAYTTVMTSLKTLEQKGYLKTSQEERAFVYNPAQPKHAVMKAMVKEFIDRVFNGSGRPLVVHLLENDRLSDADLRDIVKMMGKRR